MFGMDHNKPSVLTERYEVGRLLGQGAFAKVYYARSIRTNQSVAVKVIDKDKIMRVGLVDQIKREISVMRIVRHPNIVHLYEVMATKSKIFFVMEYAKGGELFNKVAKGKLKEDAARNYFQQLINTVDFCHSRGVYHRDIKPENLLLDENENLKISDFGLSALARCKHQDGLLHTTCGTPAYVAPEVINRKGYDGEKADIWSCGVVLFVLLAGYLPFHDTNLIEMYRKIGKAEFKCPHWFPTEVRRLLCKILDPNPSTRISMAKIRESSWLRKGMNQKQKQKVSESKDVASQDTGASAPQGSSSIAAEIKQELDFRKGMNQKQKQKVTESKDAASQDIGPAPQGSSSIAAEIKQELGRLQNLNAFDIISLSAGFDLSGFFDENPLIREARFTSNQPASDIISKLEEIAKPLSLKVMKKDGGLMKFEGLKEGRKGIMSIDAEIFQITPNFHLVEMKKSNGDTLEYQKLLKDDIRPALREIVWVWQGEQQQPLGQQLEPQQQQDQQPQPQELQHHQPPQEQQQQEQY